MKLKLKYLFSYILIFITTFVNAQSAAEVEMADTFRSEGKIYVVLAVVLIILIGLFTYMIRLDRKLLRLEKNKL